MHTILIILHLLVCISLITLVLLQQGRGADTGAAFGAGSASGNVFGARGAANFLTRTTSGLATAFFVLSLILAYFVNQSTDGSGSVTEQIETTAPRETPVISDEIPQAAVVPTEAEKVQEQLEEIPKPE